MNVKGLIEALKKVKDQEQLVYVRGYEDGVDDVEKLVPVNVKRDSYIEWYYGLHDVVFVDDDEGVIGIELSTNR